jgi:hypothetical protein
LFLWKKAEAKIQGENFNFGFFVRIVCGEIRRIE